MLQPVIRRVPGWICAFLIFILGSAASGLYGAPAHGEEGLGGFAQAAQLNVTDLLLFALIGLAAGSAALAVRMVRRWH